MIIKKAALSLGALILFCAMTMSEASASEIKQFQQKFWSDWLETVETRADAAELTRRIASIKQQLADDSGRTYPLLVVNSEDGQAVLIEAASNEDVILIDEPTLSKVPSILAFWLAQGWAHKELKHPRTTSAASPDFYPALRKRALHHHLHEGAADYYAGRFLARHGYDAGPVLESLCHLPYAPPHRSGAERAYDVAKAYTFESGEDVTVLCPFDPAPVTTSHKRASAPVPAHAPPAPGNAVGQQVAKEISRHVEREVEKTVGKVLGPALKTLQPATATPSAILQQKAFDFCQSTEQSCAARVKASFGTCSDSCAARQCAAICNTPGHNQAKCNSCKHQCTHSCRKDERASRSQCTKQFQRCLAQK